MHVGSVKSMSGVRVYVGRFTKVFVYLRLRSFIVKDKRFRNWPQCVSLVYFASGYVS